MTSESSHHTSSEPDAWPTLLKHVEHLPQDPHNLTGIKEFHGVLRGLSPDEIDLNRYHGLGLVARRLTPHLTDLHKLIVSDAAQGLLAHHQHYARDDQQKPTDGLYANELLSTQLHGSASNLAVIKACIAVTPTELALTNHLTVHHAARREPENNRLWEVIETVPHEDTTFFSLAENIFAAGSTIYRLALNYHLPPDVESSDFMIREYFTPEQLAHIASGALAKQAARLHLIELAPERLPDIKSKISMRKSGQLALDLRTILADPPVFTSDDKKDGLHLHTVRLGCPVLKDYRLIPEVMKMLPEIVVTADKLIERTN